MKEIEITSNNYNPNMKILKNHIIKFNEHFIYLYNMEGNLLHSININSIVNIEDICIINNNYLIGYTEYDLFKIIIKDDQLHIKDINNNREEEMNHDFFSSIFPYKKILNVIYSAKNKLLIIPYEYHIEIRDINSLNENPIQKININYSFLLNMNKNLFIAFSENSISLYKKIIGTKYYQLSSKIILPINLDNNNYKRLLKLDNKILMVLTNDIIYLINIKTMKICQEFFLLDYPGEIDFIYKIKDNIYVCKNNNLLELKYYQKKITLINSKIQNTLFSLNYLCNLLLEKKYPLISNKIKINCIENKIIHKLFYLIIGRKNKNTDFTRRFYSYNNDNIIRKITYLKLLNDYMEIIIKNKINLIQINNNNNNNKLIIKKKKEIFQNFKNIKKCDLRTEKIMRKRNKIKYIKKTYPPKNFKKNYR